MGRNHVAKLSDIEAGLPSLAESAACAQRLRSAFFEGVGEADVTEIVKKQVAKAREGDTKAAKFIFDMVNQAAPRTTINVGIRANQAGQRPPGPSALPAAGEPDDEGADKPSVKAVRVRCAQVLAERGPLSIRDVAEAGRFRPDDVLWSLEDSDWFELQEDGRYAVTARGRKEAVVK